MSETIKTDGSSKEKLLSLNLVNIKPLNDQLSIGEVSHGPDLAKAIANKELESFFEEFAALYRDIYGRLPWQEYLVCQDKKCAAKQMIPPNETIGEADLKYLKAPDLAHCPKCNGAMEFFYEPKAIVDNLREIFSRKVFACLLFNEENGKLAGFSLGCESTVKEGYKDKIIIGTGDSEPNFSYQEYLDEFRGLAGINFSEEEPLLNIAELGKERHIKSRIAVPLVHGLLSLADRKIEKNSRGRTAAIAHTIVGSPVVQMGNMLGTVGPVREGSSEVRIYGTLERALSQIEKFL